MDCNTPHDVTYTDETDYGLRCDCGGLVISPSGKMHFRIVDRRYGEVPV